MSAHKDYLIYSHTCPFCRTKSNLLKGNKQRRYFCSVCCIEFTTDDTDVVAVYAITSSGDIEEIKDWKK